jgi:hypothetical protein
VPTALNLTPAPATNWPPAAWPGVSANVSKILWQLWSMLFAPPIHRAVRNQLLTNVELARVESDLDLDVDADKNKASGIKGWMYVKGVSLERALLDVGHQLSLLDEVRYRRTLQELGEEYPANLYSTAGQLRWDRD